MDLPTPLAADPVHQRATELDALGAIISWDGRDKLAAILTHQDVATLRHLARAGMGDNTLRALTSDLGYLEAWCRAATQAPLPWPASEALVLKFIAHHLFDPAHRETDKSHGMPDDVRQALSDQRLLRKPGPHAPATVQRRLSSWSTLHQWRNLKSPITAPAARKAMGLASRASTRPRTRKSRTALTRNILDRIAATCRGDRLCDVRDSALLWLAFVPAGYYASGSPFGLILVGFGQRLVVFERAFSSSVSGARVRARCGSRKTLRTRYR